MKELSFNAKPHEVRGILYGRQSQFRRVVKPQPDFPVIVAGDPQTHRYGMPGREAMTLAQLLRLCPYGKPGDRLWVREAHAFYSLNFENTGQWHPSDPDVCCHYREGAPSEIVEIIDQWRPSIHMPRRASRITLEITGVRVERLHDISEDDVMREGVFTPECAYALNGPTAGKMNFAALWQSINGPDSWTENPWVWVIEFKRVTP